MYPLASSLLLLVGARQLVASPVQSGHIIPAVSNTAGFHNATLSLSAGGTAICIGGDVLVSATTHSNEKILLDSPTNQIAVTSLFLDYVQINSTLQTRVKGGDSTISGTYKINAKLCYPLDWNEATSSKTVQFLIHGIGFDKTYWDFSEGYSYVDAAAAAGYPTFSYDRLGVGASDHPDPIQVVQAPLQLEIAHSLIQCLRYGAFANQAFSHVAGVGHSFGSIQLVGLAATYPKDVDTVVLTGFSTATSGLPLALVAFNAAIANQNQPLRFGALPNGYLVTDSPISNQLAFLHAPSFDPKSEFCSL